MGYRISNQSCTSIFLFGFFFVHAFASASRILFQNFFFPSFSVVFALKHTGNGIQRIYINICDTFAVAFSLLHAILFLFQYIWFGRLDTISSNCSQKLLVCLCSVYFSFFLHFFVCFGFHFIATLQAILSTQFSDYLSLIFYT